MGIIINKGGIKVGIANIGIPGLILILVIALVIFGPNKLPELGKAAGSTLREFKSATKGLMDEDEDVKKPVQKSEEQEETKN